ncbi:hypothetical protein [Nocardia asteroides]|uniref:hypothetical protein n=1 Tax=Nocardia asteroides TaxID=1824 RepID=UPI001E4216AD|nr:hypothetical protein [Nocardia asteroides]UGT55790.1 hypothetical protein LTT85_02590 [Nocardia asteroides]
MTDRTAAGFGIDDLSVGPFAHGFGTTDEGNAFSFRTHRAILTLQIYRADLGEDVPGADDVVAVARAQVTDIDLGDERSVAAFVRDLIPTAVPVVAPAGRDATAVRSLLGRISSVIDGM